MNELIIDLSKPPEERWEALVNHKEGFNALLNFFSGEILDLVPDEYIAMLDAYAKNYLNAVHYNELLTISQLMGMPLKKVLAGNLYYDALKIALGCSAFAVSNPSGPIHARNLDWHSNDNDLSTHSLVTRFVNGKNEYLTVGWPGFTGCLSGMAIGKFSISLNSVWSTDPVTMAEPIVYLIRKVLEEVDTFEEAVEILKTTPIASDCLLLICGTKPAEIAVIERTPLKGKIRYSENGRIMVTNDYKLISPEEKTGMNGLFDSSCGRYNRMETLLDEQAIFSPHHLYRVLSDSSVRMGITMQQMYFNPKAGMYKLF